MTRLIKISAALMFAATAAAAQVTPDLGRIFDGRQGLKGFAPESVVPVIRETKPVEAPRIGSIRALSPEAAAVAPAVDLVPVAIEIEVSANASPIQAVSERVGQLSADYLFHPDSSFEPIRIVEFHILPFPPITEPRASYIVRGQVPAPKLERIKQDGAVKQVYQDRATDPKALEEVVLRYGKAIRRERGVRDVYVGLDCGLQGKHMHIQAHHPAIVVETDGSIGVLAVRQEIFQTLPALAIEPIVFVQK